MPFLVLGGVTIPVAADPVAADVERFEDTADAWDGTALTRRRAEKQVWQCTTRWLTAAEAPTVLAALRGTPPTAATGDLTGALDVIVRWTGSERSRFADGIRTRYTFTLREV